MQDLTIQDWDMLIVAREHRGNDIEGSDYYLDRETGEVQFFSFETVDEFESERDGPPSVEWMRTELDNYRQIFEEPGRYIQIRAIDSHEAWERMSAFAHRVDNAAIAARLERALAGRGAFRRFRDEVYAAGLKNDWHAFEYHRQIGDAVAWLHSVDIRPANPPQTQLPTHRSESEQRLDAALSGALTQIEEIVRSFNTSEIDEIEALLLARRVGESLVEL